MTGRANWRTPDATKTKVDEHADRIGWLRQRRNGIGGTDAAALLGVHVSLEMSTAKVKVTPGRVFLDKTATDEPHEDDKPIFAYGHAMEPRLMAEAEARFGITTKPGGFYRNKAEPWRYANPDALSSDGGIVEGKTCSHRSKAAAKWLAGDVSPHAFIQTQHYLAVTGRAHSYYSVAVRDDFTKWDRVDRALWGEEWFADMSVKEFVQVGPIARDEAVIAHLLDVEREFWAYVQSGVMPDHLADDLRPDERYTVATPDRDVEPPIPEMFNDDLARLARIKAQQTALGEQRETIEDRIKAAIGDGEYLTLGGVRRVRWATTKGRASFDRKTFRKDHPDLDAQYAEVGEPGRRLTVVGGDDK